MSLDYETFKQHQERYEREKADREDAEKWRQERERQKSSRDKEADPDKKKEPVPAEHAFRK